VLEPHRTQEPPADKPRYHLFLACFLTFFIVYSSIGMFCLADSRSLNSEQKNPWTSEDFWLEPSVKSQLETKEEDAELRKSLDRFYEMFGCPQPASGSSLSASVCRCLSQKITELKDRESHMYTLRTFQMAQVIFNRDGYSVLQRHSRDTHFYPQEEASASLDNEKPTPGLSKDVICFILKQSMMKDP
uniref:Shieldin complex subunit 1 C-terminal domain-containing protein n=2 Tax=Castor canadensis TaxID=51338 RepID=A0A8C0VYK1_CASCN